MARLKVQERARARGLNLSQLQMQVSNRMGRVVPLGTIRRYWYSTKDGKEQGPPIELVDVFLLGTIARALEVPVSELLNEEELGQMRQAQQAA
jgi:hypothetical protein